MYDNITNSYVNADALSEAYGTEIKRYFYYITSDEGLCSHIQQLEHVWRAAIVTNRIVYAVSHHSKHYPDVPLVTLCDLINMPPSIKCIVAENTTILRNHKCIYTGIMHPPARYKWEKLVNITTAQFDFNRVECVAGPINSQVGLYDRTIPIHADFLRMPVLNQKFYELLPRIRRALGMRSQDYITVHWRRGDQLSIRCKRLDNSSNCDDVGTFVRTLDYEIKKYVPETAQSQTTYIATNERNVKTLDYLTQNKFKLYSDLANTLKKLASRSTSLDAFMIELALMCDSKYFFSMGVSSVNRFIIRHCRNSHQVTIHNGILIDYNSEQDIEYQYNNMGETYIGRNVSHSVDAYIAKNYSKSFYYVQANEGIPQQLMQLYYVWKASIAVNRSVIAVDFQSPHHVNDTISLCDLFAITSDIQCISTPNITILKNHDCLYTSISTPKDVFGWKEINLKSSISFDYAHMDCIAGPISPDVGFYPSIENMNIPSLLQTQFFSDKYIQWIPSLRKVLGVTSCNYTLIHFKKGDHSRVISGCKKVKNHMECDDKSVAMSLNHIINKYTPESHQPERVIIITNENDRRVLGTLQSLNYTLWHNIRKDLSAVTLNPSWLDIYMMELLLMCDARDFFIWGVHTAQRFLMTHCRKKDQATFLDGEVYVDSVY